MIYSGPDSLEICSFSFMGFKKILNEILCCFGFTKGAELETSIYLEVDLRKHHRA